MPKLTMLQAEKLIRRDHPGLWEKFTPQERREALRRLNSERAEIDAYLSNPGMATKRKRSAGISSAAPSAPRSRPARRRSNP
jgi:hypothetical protein